MCSSDLRSAIGKLHPDAHLTDFAGHLVDPKGLAFDPDGSLYLANGKAGRLLKFRAPPAAALTAPAFTNHLPITITGAADPGALVDVFVDATTPPVAAIADETGAFAMSLTLAPDHVNSFAAFATTHAGDGLTSHATEGTIVHDSAAPTLDFRAPRGGSYVRLDVGLQVNASDGGSGVGSLVLTVGGRSLTDRKSVV